MLHAFLPPSGSHAWQHCALWPTMNAQFPQDDTPSSLEGTAAHWVAWELLAGRKVSENQLAPGDIVVTGEMLDGAEMLIEEIEKRIPSPTIEQTVHLPRISRECFGTPDAWGTDGFVLHIIDYKYGHRFVDEYFNPQGLLYLFGIIDTVAHVELDADIEFTIVQPRCYYRGAPVRSHRFKLREAFDHFAKLQEAAQRALQPNPPATTNPACNDCPGRHSCPTLQKAAYSDAEYSGGGQPHTLTPQAAALELRMLERAYQRLEARVEGLRELTTANLKAGIAIPYYHLEESKPRQQWNIPVENVITMGQLLGKDLKKPAVLTPLQAKKIGIDEAVIKAYSLNVPGTMKLAADDTKDVRRVFGGI